MCAHPFWRWPGDLGSHRRAWWMILGAVPVFALFLHLSAGALGQSEGLRFLSFFPLLLSLLFAAAAKPNVTERDRRKSFAGIPERLFTLPVRTSVLVTCPMVCGVLSVVGLYLAGVKLVFEPAGIHYLVLARHAAGSGNDPLSVGHLVPGRLSIHPADHSLIRAVVPGRRGLHAVRIGVGERSKARMAADGVARRHGVCRLWRGAPWRWRISAEAADAAGNGGEYWLKT